MREEPILPVFRNEGLNYLKLIKIAGWGREGSNLRMAQSKSAWRTWNEGQNTRRQSQ